jgi:hypothetical protein
LAQVHLHVEWKPCDAVARFQTWLAKTPEARAVPTQLVITFARCGWRSPAIDLRFPNARTILLHVAMIHTLMPFEPYEALKDALRPMKDDVTITQLQLQSFGHSVSSLFLRSVLRQFSFLRIEKLSLAGSNLHPVGVMDLAPLPPLAFRANRLVCTDSAFGRYRGPDAIAFFGLFQAVTSFSLLGGGRATPYGGRMAVPGFASLPNLRVLHLELQGLLKVCDGLLFELLATHHQLETLTISNLCLSSDQWVPCLRRLPPAIKHFDLQRPTTADSIDPLNLSDVIQLLNEGWLAELRTIHFADRRIADDMRVCSSRPASGEASRGSAAAEQRVGCPCRMRMARSRDGSLCRRVMFAGRKGPQEWLPNRGTLHGVAHLRSLAVLFS